MNAIQNFAFEEHLVRVVEHTGETWFVGPDVCKALDIKNGPHALARLDPDERASDIAISDTSGTKYATIVSEAGVYRLVFTSRKEQAERFKRWLAHEVLPALRRTGEFRMADAASDPLPTLDNSSIAIWRTKIDLVREARIQFGPARARLLWASLGLPDVPSLPDHAENILEDGNAVLRLIILHHVAGRPALDWLDNAGQGDAVSLATLEAYGLRPGTAGFWIANGSPAIVELFATTPLRDGRWISALRQLPGVSAGERQTFAGRQHRTTWLPAALLVA